jgi:hypothetical protein
MRRVAFLLVPLWLLACDRQPPTSPPDATLSVTGDDEMYVVVGEGYLSSDPTFKLVLNAVRTFSSNVAGNLELAGLSSRAGSACPSPCPVTGIVPPDATYDHWCIDVTPTLPDYFPVVQVYVRDVGDGKTTFDQMAFGGDFVASCQLYPEPSLDVWFTLAAGDFKGVVRTR